MFKRSNFKKTGLKKIYANIKACIAISFIYTILIGGNLISFNHEWHLNPKDNIRIINVTNLRGNTNSEIVNEFISGITGNKPFKGKFITHATQGILGSVVNNVSSSGSYLFGFLNAVNELLFKDRIWASVIIIIGAILSFLYWVFVSKVLEVGYARFFLENRKYTKTKINKLLLPYKLNKTTHIAYTMLVKNIYNLLWDLTIIGGIIKHYSYMLVPYILAENPNIKTKDAIKLSRDLMNGYKWECFKLDLSFIGWRILGIITFNISNIVFTNPYYQATKTEVYMYLRDKGKLSNIKESELLKDYNLEGEPQKEEYPIYDYMLKNTKKGKLNFNYNRKYKADELIIMFFIFSFVGWLYEVLLTLFEHGILVNRGTFYGPWLPIYGAGAVLLIILLRPIRKNIFAYFCLSMVICGTIEYFTSLYLELVHHMAWWDYHGYFLNLNGRTSLEALILFASGGTFVTYIIAPLIANLLDKIKKNIKIILCIILLSIFVIDYVVATIHPNGGQGISVNLKED